MLQKDSTSPSKWASGLHSLFALLPLVWLLAGCANEPDPTPAEPEETLTLVVSTPTPEPTATPFPATSTPTQTPTITPTPSPTPLAINVIGVLFDAPDWIGESFVESDLEATDQVSSHRLIELNEFQVPEGHSGQAELRVYPAREFASLNGEAQLEIDNLKRWVDRTLVMSQTVSLPYLPLLDNPQRFGAAPQSLAFETGQGFRYITQFGSPNEIFSNSELIYTFQGLTDDGQSYLALDIPITLDLDQIDQDIVEQLLNPSFTFQYQDKDYAADIDAALTDLPPDAFRPNLGEIDRFVRSIYAKMPEPLLRFDENGEVDLTVVYPQDNGVALTGRDLAIQGYTQPGFNEEVRLTLEIGEIILFEEIITSALDGWWQADIFVPLTANGEARLIASSIRGEDRVTINLLPDRTILLATDTDLSLSQPEPNQAVPNQYAFYLEGNITNPIDDTITIGLLVNNCTTFVARQSFPVLSGYWFGFVIPPEGITGEACAIAYTGTFGRGEWREVRIPVELVDPTSVPAENRLSLGTRYSPIYKAGATLFLSGSAIGDEGTQLSVSITNSDNTLLSSGETSIDGFGVWNIELGLPDEVTETIEIELLLDDEEQSQTTFEVEITE